MSDTKPLTSWVTRMTTVVVVIAIGLLLLSVVASLIALLVTWTLKVIGGG